MFSPAKPPEAVTSSAPFRRAPGHLAACEILRKRARRVVTSTLALVTALLTALCVAGSWRFAVAAYAQGAAAQAPAAQSAPPAAPAAAPDSHAPPVEQPTDRPAAPPADHPPAAGAPAPHAAPAGEAHAAEEAHGESPWALVARVFNFLLLVGGLVYFLRSPLAQHLSARSQQIRADLVTARETTERARAALADIDRRVQGLPAELQLLKTRGAEEIAAESQRIRQQAEAERHRLLEQTRREVEVQVRLAKQSLAEHAANLAVQLASDRITRTITPDDQTRLIDRYVAGVKELHG